MNCFCLLLITSVSLPAALIINGSILFVIGISCQEISSPSKEKEVKNICVFLSVFTFK